ncbi:MAG: hypothetical protein SH808_14085 [Saprospiraceae bacterium]|nr:hypothetical protein [Saprospiraceae bacterium]
MENFNFNFFIHKLTLVDSAIVCLISDGLDTLYFDMNGNEVENNDEYIVYDTVVAMQSGYFAALGEVLFRMNELFDVVDSTILDDDIQTISLSGDSLIIVSTSSSLVILDANLEAVVYSDVYANFNLFSYSTDWIWSVRKTWILFNWITFCNRTTHFLSTMIFNL